MSSTGCSELQNVYFVESLVNLVFLLLIASIYHGEQAVPRVRIYAWHDTVAHCE